MDGYKLKEAFESSVELSEAKMAKELDVPGLLLDWRCLTAYRAVDPGNVRLRTLLNTTIGKGTWQLLWIPPSLPYYDFGFPFSLPEVGAFTKRLVFSSWRVAPRVIAGLLSYEAERLAIRSFEKHATNTGEARKRRRGLLRFAKKDDRLAGMPVLALMYPCVTLARECDPLKLLGADRELSRLSDVLTSVSRRIDELLADIAPRGTGKAADAAWYWAAPILLDLKLDRKGTRRWFSQEGLAQIWSGELAGTDYEENSLWAEHVAEA